MEQDQLIGVIALGVIVICVIALVVMMIKKIINKIIGVSPEREKKTVKKKQIKEKKPKRRVKKKKSTKKQGVPLVAIPEREVIYDSNPNIDEEDDEEETLLMRKSEPEITIQLISDTTGARYSALCANEIVIGRKSGCDIQILGDKAVSGKHCMIKNNGNNGVSVLDVGSSNGTYLNDEMLTKEKVLETGDTLEIGRTRYSVQILGV